MLRQRRVRVEVGQHLVIFAAQIAWARGQGVNVERYNLAHQPLEFAGHPVVAGILQRSGTSSLPVILVDGEAVLSGRYPNRDEIAGWLVLPFAPFWPTFHRSCSSPARAASARPPWPAPRRSAWPATASASCWSAPTRPRTSGTSSLRPSDPRPSRSTRWKASGPCSNWHEQLPAHCLDDEGTSGISWILGHVIDGTQAEYVRVPFAESSLHKLPEGVSDEAAVLLSDIPPTGFEIGARNGTAGLYGASRVIAVDLDALGMTDGMGVDVAIEAVGVAATFGMATELIRPGGTVANVGVLGESVKLRLRDFGSRTSRSSPA